MIWRKVTIVHRCYTKASHRHEFERIKNISTVSFEPPVRSKKPVKKPIWLRLVGTPFKISKSSGNTRWETISVVQDQPKRFLWELAPTCALSFCFFSFIDSPFTLPLTRIMDFSQPISLGNTSFWTWLELFHVHLLTISCLHTWPEYNTSTTLFYHAIGWITFPAVERFKK